MAGKKRPAEEEQEQKRAETRERLFQAALAEFRRKGVSAARVESIAQAAKAARTNFYFYFPTKDHVLQELQLRGEEITMKTLEALDPKSDGLRALLDAFMRGFQQGLTAIGSAPLARETLAHYIRGAPAAAHPKPIYEKTIALLKAAQQRGEVRTDISAENAALIIFTSAFGIFAAHIENPQPDSLRHWFEIVQRGLSPK